jgi:hypothetical protein
VDVLATSIGTHVAYVGSVAAVDAVLARPGLAGRPDTAS